MLRVDDSPPFVARVMDGRFEGRVLLHEGENRILATATAIDGRVADAGVPVTVRAPGCGELQVKALRDGSPALSVSDRAVELVVDYLAGGIQFEDEPDLEDSSYRGGLVSLGSPVDRSRLSWRASYSRQDVDYDVSEDVLFEEAALEFGWQANSSLQLVALGGRDSDLRASLSEGGLEESRWEVGLAWTRGANHRFELRGGQRFFGDTYRVNWSYTGRVLSLGVAYDEVPTTIGQEQLDRPESFIIDSPSVDSLPLGIEVEPYILRAGSVEIGLTGARNQINLGYYDEEREFIDTEEITHGKRAELDWNFVLGPRTTLFAGVDWERAEIREEDDGFDLWTFQTGLQRRVTPTIDVGLILSHWRRTADIPENLYRENAISLDVVKRFGGSGRANRGMQP